jgi:RNA polymerase sigma-70 factor (ECF subfamily)
MPAGEDATGDHLERRWLERASQGDEQAFAELVRHHQDQLYRIALRMVGDPGTAQDVVQEALLQAWQHLPSFRGEARFSTWVTRIVINRCHNVQQRIRTAAPLRESQEGDAVLPWIPAAETEAMAAQTRSAVREALLSLPFDQRAPLVLTTFAGCTHAEAGSILGISESAAKVRAHRARRTLAGRLQEWR